MNVDPQSSPLRTQDRVVALSRLAIVCPMANEEMTALSFAGAILANATFFKDVCLFVVLDHTSKDRTRGLLLDMAHKEERLRVIWAPDNRNVVDAYARGYREAIATGFEWILEIDAGFSHDPADFSKFLEKIDGDYAAIFGSRFCDGGRIVDTSFKRQVVSKWGTALVNVMLGTKLTDMTSGYQLFRRETLIYVLQRGIRSKAHFFQTEMKVHCRNMRLAEVPIWYKSDSNSVGYRELLDAFANLGRLTVARATGRL